MELKDIPIPKFTIGEQVIAKGIVFYNVYIVKDLYYDKIEWRYSMKKQEFFSPMIIRGESEIKSVNY